MKKILFLAFIGFLFSCVSTKEVAQTQAVSPSPPKKEKNNLMPWRQDYFPDIKIKDRVFFYNADSIKIEKTFGKKTFFVEDGIVKAVDSLSIVCKIVPRLTTGIWISEIRNSIGDIKTMLISFSRNEANYNLTYIRGDDGVFVLSNKAQITFNGNNYNVLISTLDPRLLFRFEKYKTEEKVIEKAEGYK